MEKGLETLWLAYSYVGTSLPRVALYPFEKLLNRFEQVYAHENLFTRVRRYAALQEHNQCVRTISICALVSVCMCGTGHELSLLLSLPTSIPERTRATRMLPLLLLRLSLSPFHVFLFFFLSFFLPLAHSLFLFLLHNLFLSLSLSLSFFLFFCYSRSVVPGRAKSSQNSRSDPSPILLHQPVFRFSLLHPRLHIYLPRYELNETRFFIARGATIIGESRSHV